MTEREAGYLKTEFNTSFCNLIEEKWAGVVARSFSPILSISDKEKQITSVQKWTHQYFEGVNYFNRWDRSLSFISGEFVAKLQQMTSPAYRDHCHLRMQEKIRVMQARVEKDPVAFRKFIEQIDVKAAKDPNSLSPFEKEYLEFAEFLAGSVLGYWPKIEKESEILKKCIWNGFTLLEAKILIIDNDSSDNLFRQSLS